MKKISILFTILLCVLLLGSCKSKKAPAKPAEPTIVTLKPSQIENALRDKTYELGKRILMTCNTSKFKPFTTSEATPSVIANTTQTRLTKTCLKFRLKYGAFKDIVLVEVMQNKTDDLLIFRYKALYEKKIANKELRVTMNKDNKVSAINSRDWIDKYQP